MNTFKKIILVVILGLVLIGLYIANNSVVSDQNPEKIDTKVKAGQETPKVNVQSANDEKKDKIKPFRTKRIVPKDYKGKTTKLLIYEGITDPNLDSIYIYKLSDESTGARYILDDANILEMAVGDEHGTRTLHKGEQYGATYNKKFAIFVPREMADNEAPEKLIWGEKPKATVAPKVKQQVSISGLSKYKDLTVLVETREGFKTGGVVPPNGDVTIDVSAADVQKIGIFEITEKGGSAVWLSKGDWTGKSNIAFGDLKNEFTGETRTVVVSSAKKDATYELSFVMKEGDIMAVKALPLGGDNELNIKLPIEAKFYCVYSPEGKSNYLPLMDKIDLSNIRVSLQQK